MADLKKALIEQMEGLLRKGELKGSEYRTLVTKIELADPRFLKLAMDKFQALRKTVKTEEDEKEVEKADAVPAPATSAAPSPTSSALTTGTNASANAGGAGAMIAADRPAAQPFAPGRESGSEMDASKIYTAGTMG